MIDIYSSGWQSGPDISGDDDEDTALLREMYAKAVEYVKSFSWAPPIKVIYFGFGIGGVIALFLVEFDYPIENDDDKIWIVVGDLPSAYLVTDDAPDPASALQVYCELMSKWVESVSCERSSDDVFPVDAAKTKDNSEQLRDRVAFILTDIIPSM